MGKPFGEVRVIDANDFADHTSFLPASAGSGSNQQRDRRATGSGFCCGDTVCARAVRWWSTYWEDLNLRRKGVMMVSIR
jgi:hypothetical protein